MRNVRIRFSKTGRAKYISHLDLNRCMTRAIRCAKIPIWYTEGFNPHPYLNFLLPLPLGQESLTEALDIRVTGEIGDEEIVTALNRVLPEGMAVTSAGEPWNEAAELVAAEYDILLEGAQSAQAIKSVLDAGGLKAGKLSKQGRRKVVKEIDVSLHILSYNVFQQENGVLINAVISAGNSNNLNPSLLVSALSEKTETEYFAKTTRKRLLTAELKDFA